MLDRQRLDRPRDPDAGRAAGAPPRRPRAARRTAVQLGRAQQRRRRRRPAATSCVFLNNDIEAHRDGWLSALCAQALRADVGAVGARLLYPDGRLQHCGIVVGLTGAAGHPLVGLAEDAAGYLHMAASPASARR